MIRFLAATFTSAAVIIAAGGIAAAAPISFRIERDGGGHVRVHASGEIDAAASTRFSEFTFAQKLPPGTVVVLDSAGGDIRGAIGLGRIIRFSELRTTVGATCRDACVLVYLAGAERQRSAAKGLALTAAFADTGDASAAQGLANAVGDYVLEIGAWDAFEALAKASPQSVRAFLDRRDRTKSGSSDSSTTWTINEGAEAVSLTGERYGRTYVFNLSCSARDPWRLVVRFPSEGAGVLALGAESLVVDSERPSLMGRRVRQAYEGGAISLTYRLDASLAKAISKAEWVGVQLQTTFESVFFHGFDDMPFRGGAAQWSEFAKACSKLRAKAAAPRSTRSTSSRGGL